MGERIVLAGGSGFLGRALQSALERRGYTTRVLTRSPQRPGDVSWDGRTVGEWCQALTGAKAVINLSGRSVDCRHTPANKAEILASRVASVEVLHRALGLVADPPEVWVQAGSQAIYGDAGERECSEDAEQGDDFSSDVCRAWEGAFEAGSCPSRRVFLRIGLVLAEDGGALGKLSTLTRAFLGGTVGSGRQYMPWIHVDDFCRIVLRTIEDPALRGTYNATGPSPARNRDFMRALRKVHHRPWSPPAPRWAVHVGAWLMRTDPGLALTGRRGVPRRLIDEHGFGFRYPDLDRALESIYTAEAGRSPPETTLTITPRLESGRRRSSDTAPTSPAEPGRR